MTPVFKGREKMISNIHSEIFNFSIQDKTVNMVFRTQEKTINFDSANLTFSSVKDANCFLDVVFTLLNLGRQKIFIPNETFYTLPNSKVRRFLKMNLYCISVKTLKKYK